MGKADGWDSYLGTTGIKSASQDVRRLLWTPTLLSDTARFPMIKPCKWPWNSHGVRSESGLPQRDPQCWWGGPACPHRVIFSHRSNRSFSKDLSVVLSWSWGEAGWSTRSCFPDPLMQSVWVSVLQRGSASASHPHPRILSGVSHSWIVLIALLVRVTESRMTYVAILVRVKVFKGWDKWHMIGRKSHCSHSFSTKLKLEDVQVSPKYVFTSKKWLMWLKVRSLLPLKLPISSFFFRHTNFIHGNWITGVLLSLHSKCKKH